VTGKGKTSESEDASGRQDPEQKEGKPDEIVSKNGETNKHTKKVLEGVI